MRQIFVPLLCAPFIASAQGQLDISLHQDINAVEVRVRPTSDFDGLFSSIVFTLRTTSGVTLGAVSNDALSGTHVAASGPTMADGDHQHQVYTGFGFTPFTELGIAWEAGAGYAVCTIAYEGVGTIELVNDVTTSAHNGDYYISLNGLDRTGLIYDNATTAIAEDEDPITDALLVWPNPTSGPVNVALDDFDGQVTLDVLDALGQVVISTRTSDAMGRLDLGAAAAGRYMVRATQGARVVQSPLVVQ